jgi:hypothetical protein
MLINENGKSIFIKNSTQTPSKIFKLPISNLNNQSRNYNNPLIKEKKIRKYSMYSTKEATPRKEYNQIVIPPTIKNTFYKPEKEKYNKNELDDSLSQISNLINNNKKDLNYSGLIGKIPGINEEPNFVYDQILFNKSRINKAKILSHKIGVLKLPISKISTKEALTNSDREKKCFSDRVQEGWNTKKDNNNDDNVGISCCFFGKK